MLPGADFALSPGVRLLKGYLRDSCSRRYPLNEAGALVAALSTEPITVEHLNLAVARSLDADPAVIRPAVTTFLIDLQARGLGSIGQSFGHEWVRRLAAFPSRLIAMVFVRALIPISWQSRRRYPPTLAGVVRACAESHQQIGWIALVMGVVACAVLPFAQPATVHANLFRDASIWAVIAGVIVTSLISAVIHELGHLWAVRLQKGHPVAAQARLGAASVVSVAASPRQRILVALAGPAAGFCAPVGAAVFILELLDWAPARVFGDSVNTVYLGACAVLAGGQLAALVPPSRDAKVLWAGLVELIIHTKEARCSTSQN